MIIRSNGSYGFLLSICNIFKVQTQLLTNIQPLYYQGCKTGTFCHIEPNKGSTSEHKRPKGRLLQHAILTQITHWYPQSKATGLSNPKTSGPLPKKIKNWASYVRSNDMVLLFIQSKLVAEDEPATQCDSITQMPVDTRGISVMTYCIHQNATAVMCRTRFSRQEYFLEFVLVFWRFISKIKMGASGCCGLDIWCTWYMAACSLKCMGVCFLTWKSQQHCSIAYQMKISELWTWMLFKCCQKLLASMSKYLLLLILYPSALEHSGIVVCHPLACFRKLFHATRATYNYIFSAPICVVHQLQWNECHHCSCHIWLLCPQQPLLYLRNRYLWGGEAFRPEVS